MYGTVPRRVEPLKGLVALVAHIRDRNRWWVSDWPQLYR
jgi:hypothetical protein